MTSSKESAEESGSDSLKHKRSASQGSLHNNDNESQLLSTTRQESKNRLSFKMVKQQMKVSLLQSGKKSREIGYPKTDMIDRGLGIS